MQASLGLSDAALANVNTLPFALGFVTPPLVARVGAMIGPAALLFLGGAIASAAQLLLFLLASRTLPTPAALPPSIALVLCTMAVYVGNQFVTATAFSAPVYHFQRRRGRAVSLIKTFVGLSGAMVSQLYVLAFGVPTRDVGALRCLLLWAGVSAGCTFFGAILVPVRPMPGATEPSAMLKRCFQLLIVLAMTSTAASLFPQEGVVHGGLVVAMICMSLAPIPLALGPIVVRAPAGDAESPLRDTAVTPFIVSDPAQTVHEASPRNGTNALPTDHGVAAGGLAPSLEGRRDSAHERAGASAVARVNLVATDTAAGRTDASRQVVTIPRDETLLVMETSGQLNLTEMIRTSDAWFLWLGGLALIGSGEST